MIQTTEDIGTQWILDLFERRLHSSGLEVKSGTTNLQRKRDHNGV